jgi:hypothetical protein
MALGGLHRCRRIAGAVALVGMAFYAVLFPWHTVSQAAAQFLPSTLEKSSKPICHDSEPLPSDGGSKSSPPAKPPSQCPICKGFAALQLALVGAVHVFVRPEASVSAPRMSSASRRRCPGSSGCRAIPTRPRAPASRRGVPPKGSPMCVRRSPSTCAEGYGAWRTTHHSTR